MDIAGNRYYGKAIKLQSLEWGCPDPVFALLFTTIALPELLY